MTQQEIELKAIKAQKEGKHLFPFEVPTEEGDYELVYLFSEELTKQHKDLLLQQMLQSYSVLPIDIQQDFLKAVTKPKLTDKLIIAQR